MKAIGRDYQRLIAATWGPDPIEDTVMKHRPKYNGKRNGSVMVVKLVRNRYRLKVSHGLFMATENIILLGSAAVLCGLHVLGGPLSGLFARSGRTKKDETDDLFVVDTQVEERELVERA